MPMPSGMASPTGTSTQSLQKGQTAQFKIEEIAEIGYQSKPPTYHFFQSASPLFQRDSRYCISRSVSIGCQKPS